MTTQRRPDLDSGVGSVTDYRYDATRKNNPPAALGSQGRVQETRKQRYFYDPHLSPMLRFDETGQADRLNEFLDTAKHRPLTDKEAGLLEVAIRRTDPWLEWTGKREGRSWFEVEPVALHIHDRVSAQATIRIAARQNVQRGLWADPQLDYHEAVQFYKHDVDWSNRLILGDSLSAMNSLAIREDLAGKVQMIYVDPPYGIRFASNFQPFVGNRGVRDTDADLTRDPEVVKAYRDTWTLGVHTYLAYLRDRLTVARELLTASGSIFVQISDENVHRIRAVMDEVFGSSNFVSLITYRTSSGTTRQNSIKRVSDYIIWYCKNQDEIKFHRLLENKAVDTRIYNQLELKNGFRRPMSKEERRDPSICPESSRPYQKLPVHSMASGDNTPRELFKAVWRIPPTSHWRYAPDGFARLEHSERLQADNTALRAIYYHDDYPAFEITNSWEDTGPEINKSFIVQTSTLPIQRCMLMTTDPGDLVLDPTCGSGTTAYVAEQWGRRWITIDTSRVAIALARQRILTTRFDYYKTADGSSSIGKAGFQYKTVPHVTLQSIAQNVALDPIFAKWQPQLDEKLRALNEALAEVDNDTRSALLGKLDKRGGRRRRGNPMADAEKRATHLPNNGWEHWELPFHADTDWPDALSKRLEDYRKVWRAKMGEVNACIAANADQEPLVDQPEVQRRVVRVSGPFTIEAVHPPEESLVSDSPIGGAPKELESFGEDTDFVNTDMSSNVEAFHETLIRLLRNDGVRFQGNGVAMFTRLEPLSDGSVLHADGEWENEDSDEPHKVAVSFGPKYGPITGKQVEDSIRAAYRRSYDALVFAGFSFDGAAQAAIQGNANPQLRVHMAHIAPDVNMGDLLKETKNSQLFSVSGLPRTKLAKQGNGEYIVEMAGVDIYDPVSNTIVSENADGVAAWFVDSDYDGRTFCISQAFFPDPNVWDKLARSLKTVVDPEAFAAFKGTKSLSFPPGEHGRVAIKVIDPRGNEVMSVHDLDNPSY